ncbi:phosphatidylcholine translocator ABCB4-like [Mauremys reevesii]|uniref:phosphatidylcholine translocator ABCB4-like n=1 Tax=Mauremys reevesii TaxID=260615 RepID=UPI00193EEED3|nr:phosphatidylcholine translocator ABCB4-like [Mauremys reevesii]
MDMQKFGYANWLDIILMLIGLIAAVANGTGLPLIIVVFGEMTNSFVTIGQAVNMSSVNLPAVMNSSSTCPAIPGLDIEAEMTRFACYYAGIGFAVVILSTIQVWTFLTSAARQTARIRQNFFFAILHQEMAWFDTSQIGTLNTRLSEKALFIYAPET